ncbi:MAG: potassium channel family protein [Deltaproteobacteria bacterium]|nr:potassium channel family protein [Deltaproteobacteria bacterium]
MLTRFIYHFFHAIWRVKAVILALIALIMAGAGAITVFEKMPFADTLYFAFVTGLTIGYGDIVMKTPGGRLIALFIGLVGILFTGLLVAILVYAVRENMREFQKRN